MASQSWFPAFLPCTTSALHFSSFTHTQLPVTSDLHPHGRSKLVRNRHGSHACMHMNMHEPQPSSSTSPPARLPDPDLYSVDTSDFENNAESRLRGFIKVRASLDSDYETVFSFCGVVHAMRPGHSTIPLFRIEGFNVGVARRTDLGWRLLTREVATYTDLETGEIFSSSWSNPLTNTDNSVVHVWNDPVNQDLTTKHAPIQLTKLSNNGVCYSVDAFPRYKSPLPLGQFPIIGGPSVYESAELFSFFADHSDIVNAKKPHVTNPVSIAWSRIGPWLPWMCMRDTPGHLVYHCRGTRLQNGISGLSPKIRNFVISQNAHKFFSAPSEFSRPNETSWSYMKKLLEAKGLPRADGRVVVDSMKRADDEKQMAAHHRDRTGKLNLKLTRAQLGAFAAKVDENVPVYIAVAGRIFDVSTARRHYGYGETYQRLTGIDASVALLTGDLDMARRRRGRSSNDSEVDEEEVQEVKKEKVDLKKLTEEQKYTLGKWVEYFAERYEEVGQLVGDDGGEWEIA